jgi:hypothetical protein
MNRHFNVSEEKEKLLRQIMPFEAFRDMFNFRTMASYFLCWFSLNKNPLFETFSEPCTGHYFSSNNRRILYYDFVAYSKRSYACAELSFCPDPCCSKAFLENPPNATTEENYLSWLGKCLVHEENPCKFFSNGLCELSKVDNSNLDDLIKNNLNVTCVCPSGYEYSGRLKTCIDLDECLEKIDTCNGYKQTCLNLEGGYVCLCEDGFKRGDLAEEVNQTNQEEFASYLLQKNNMHNITCIPEEDLFGDIETNESYNISVIEQMYEEL